MCDHCVIESVKRQMLSRRSLLGGGLAAAAASVAAPAFAQDAASPAAGAAKAVRALTIADMTHELYPEFPTYFGEQQFFMEQKFSFEKDKFNLFELRVNEHTGTHVDAPLHFSEDGQSVAEIPVEKLMAPLVVIDIKAKAAEDPNAQVTPDDLKAWIDAHGDMPENCCVAMNSGWQQHLGTDMFRNADADGTMHFPGFHLEAVQMLLEGSAVGIAVDTLSLDFGQSPDFAVHYGWLPTGRWGLECIANLDAMPATGATLIVGAPKHRGGTGGPARVFALT
ncbi:cyclase family protein [Aurantimonas sp. HBX-1]|uniref:cyclase family protein n=1 Tax=Aurantimonas sp. HBX-1 TaxID=2906072 RepID=UPI001F3BBED6|nr:cyclase family protein [Aurantimonas sp. HBX-1]UIJ72295.1 cyclase family protein [Aurantimonas sp. HBX-1]